MKFTRHFRFILILMPLIFIPASAWSIPILQLYAEGATYNSATESWEVNFSEGNILRLWAIGNVAGPGGQGDILDVKLAVAYEAEDAPTIIFTPSTTGGYGGFTDPSTSISPGYLQTVEDGSTPLLGDGSPLPSHGEYGDGIYWQEFSLGNFTLEDSPMADFIYTFPSPLPVSSGLGQINVYDVTVDGLSHGDTLHFDLYNHVIGKNNVKYKFAPFSHDLTHTPEPTTMLLLGTGLIGLAAAGRRKFFRKVK